MKPCNKIKREILLEAAEDVDLRFGIPLETDEEVQAAYDMLVEADANEDFESDFRSGDVTTDIPHDYSRHYEARSVAMKMSDGTWIGWTYWYGGGKHGCPEEMEWMEEAYELTCVEETKTVVVQTFTKKE